MSCPRTLALTDGALPRFRPLIPFTKCVCVCVCVCDQCFVSAVRFSSRPVCVCLGVCVRGCSCNFAAIPFFFVCSGSVQFDETDHIRNPLGEGLPLTRARDGQEVTEKIGEELCRLVDLHSIPISPDMYAVLIPLLCEGIDK